MNDEFITFEFHRLEWRSYLFFISRWDIRDSLYEFTDSNLYDCTIDRVDCQQCCMQMMVNIHNEMDDIQKRLGRNQRISENVCSLFEMLSCEGWKERHFHFDIDQDDCHSICWRETNRWKRDLTHQRSSYHLNLHPVKEQ